MKRRFALLLVVLTICSITLTGCHEERKDVLATVVELQYIDSRPAMILPFPVILAEEYLVTVSYEEFEKTFNDKTLYDSVKEGDTIEVRLYESYTNKGLLITRDIFLISE